MMAYKTSFHLREHGFTLIELMIVIAVIGVLAAIAIPQFASYRQRSFDSSALSDVRNYKVTEETFFNSWQDYGYSTDGGINGPLALVSGPGNLNTMVSNGTNGLIFGLSNRVSLYGVVDVTGNAFNVTAKHLAGGNLYGADSDVSTIFMLASLPGTPLAVGNTPAAATPGQEFAGWISL